MTNLLFKTYFQVCKNVGGYRGKQLTDLQINAVGLSKNLLRALNAQSQDLPDKYLYPRSHIVTFNYFVGVIFFLDENYAEVRDYACIWQFIGLPNIGRGASCICVELLP